MTTREALVTVLTILKQVMEEKIDANNVEVMPIVAILQMDLYFWIVYTILFINFST